MGSDPPQLPDDVRRLLAEHVDTLEKLELLLLLSQRPGDEWTLEAAAASIRLPIRQLAEAADELAGSGLVDIGPGPWGRVKLAPASPELSRRCHALCDAYREDPVEILKIASHFALARLRRSAATAFADAFRIRRRREEGDDHG